MGRVAWHQYLAVKIDNEKLAGNVGSIQINHLNISHTAFSLKLAPFLISSIFLVPVHIYIYIYIYIYIINRNTIIY
jgi:hypothetical protein